MAENSFRFFMKSQVFRNVLESFDEDLPSKRNMAIQIDKLERLVNQFSKQFPAILTLSTPAAKLRRKKGPYLRGLAQQSKTLDKLLAKMFGEYLLQESPNLPHSTRRKIPAATLRYVHKLNTRIYEDSQRLITESTKKALSGDFGGVVPVRSLLRATRKNSRD